MTGDHPAGSSDTGVKSAGPKRFPRHRCHLHGGHPYGDSPRAVPWPRSRRGAVVGIGAAGAAADDVSGTSSAVRAIGMTAALDAPNSPHWSESTTTPSHFMTRRHLPRGRLPGR